MRQKPISRAGSTTRKAAISRCRGFYRGVNLSAADYRFWLDSAVRRTAIFVRFRNGPLFVKSSEWYLAAGLVLPFVVARVAAT